MIRVSQVRLNGEDGAHDDAAYFPPKRVHIVSLRLQLLHQRSERPLAPLILRVGVNERRALLVHTVVGEVRGVGCNAQGAEFRV